jgi:antitoxin ParD1/3/4
MAMTSLNISLPKALKKYVLGQVASGEFGTPSEYIRDLIRQDKEQVLRRRGEVGERAALQGGGQAPRRRRRSMGRSGLEVIKEVMAERRRAEQELAGE